MSANTVLWNWRFPRFGGSSAVSQTHCVGCIHLGPIRLEGQGKLRQTWSSCCLSAVFWVTKSFVSELGSVSIYEVVADSIIVLQDLLLFPVLDVLFLIQTKSLKCSPVYFLCFLFSLQPWELCAALNQCLVTAPWARECSSLLTAFLPLVWLHPLCLFYTVARL